MTIVGLIVILIVIGIVLYCVNTLIPMDSKIKTIINIVVIVAVLLWLVEAFGLLDLGGPIGHHRYR
jgi:hypothetical protein